MIRALRIVVPLLVLLALPACTAYRQIAVLRTVKFAFGGVSDVRLAGVRLTEGAAYGDLRMTDVARIAAAIAAGQVPLEFIAHLDATNPPENTVTARMVDLDWTLFIEDRRTLDGGLAAAVAIPPGATEDVPLTVGLDLAELGAGGARDLFDLAVAIAGQGSVRKDLRLELRPTIDTPLGPIRYPSPVVVRRLAPR